MLMDWPLESGKELGPTTTDLYTICKSFEVIIEWYTRACFPFPNHSFMFTCRCVNVLFIRTLFVWSHILDPGLVVFPLMKVIIKKQIGKGNLPHVFHSIMNSNDLQMVYGPVVAVPDSLPDSWRQSYSMRVHEWFLPLFPWEASLL